MLDKYIFYCKNNQNKSQTEYFLNRNYSFEFWRPSLLDIIPKRVSLNPFIVWWFFHYLHVFSNNEYGVLLVFHKNAIIHKSCIFPGYFRFPFMAKTDLQIGDIWTAPNYYNKGIATFAIQKILDMHKGSNKKIWYVVEQNNIASIRVAEKNGFCKIGEGVRQKRFGTKILGSYLIQFK